MTWAGQPSGASKPALGVSKEDLVRPPFLQYQIRGPFVSLDERCDPFRTEYFYHVLIHKAGEDEANLVDVGLHCDLLTFRDVAPVRIMQTQYPYSRNSQGLQARKTASALACSWPR